jgi:putative aldouronate transport system substrate-binding protein
VQVQNKKVSFVANTPQWREGLRYIRMLYRDGLIDPESFTQARDPGLKQKSETPSGQILGFVPSGSISAFNIYYGESGRYLEWVLVPPLKGPDGFQVAYTGPYRILPKMEVTSAAKRPDVITRWADWFYTEEGTLTSNMGQEGVGWRKGEPGEVGANGKPAIFARLTPYGRKDPYGWESTTLGDNRVDLFLGRASVRDDDQGPILYRAANLYDQYRPDEFLPYLWYSEDDAAEMAELQLAIKDYVVSSDAEFITDRKDLDGSDWDNYMRELEQIGVERYVELTQKAYDSYLANQ